MTPAVIRLALVGSRRSWGRPVGIVAGVAVGVTLFLLLLGAYGALQARDLRSGWIHPVGKYGSTLTDDTILAAATADRHAGATIDRLDIAATPGSTVRIPGIPDAPPAGSFYASPTLIERIATVPADELGDRYGTLIGTLPDSVLKGPDSLVAVVGRTPAELESQHSTRMVSELTGDLFGGNGTYRIVAVIGAIAVLFPVLLLVSIVTGLGAAQRRERFATLRLIGASPRAVTMIAGCETAATSLVGALLGVLLSFLLRPAAAALSIDGSTFFADDLAVAPGAIAVTVVVTALASALVSVRRIARAGIGPLGPARQQSETTPKSIRMLPLIGGVLMMVGIGAVGGNGTTPLPLGTLLIGSFLLVSIGLLLAGPYLTVIVSRVVANTAQSAAALIASRRILTSPRATFRSVSGLVIAVFMVSVFAGAATTAVQQDTLSEAPGLVPTSTVVAYLVTVDLTPDDLDEFRTVAGVTAVSLLYFTDDVTVLSARDASILGFTDIPDTPYVDVEGDLLANDPGLRAISPSTVASPEGLSIAAILASTDGSLASIERARTWFERSGVIDLGPIVPGTRADASDTATRTMVDSFATLAYLGVGIATLIAGISLAVATVSAILDRRRTLGLLRLIGMPTGDMRRIVLFEAAVPLLAVVALSAVSGLLVAHLLLSGLTDGRRTLGWPEPGYYIALASSLLLALGAVTVSFGTIRRSTGVTATRFE